MLKLQIKDQRQTAFWATEAQFYIGRSKSDQLQIDDLSINERHAVIQQRKGRFLLKDLASTTGSFVNGEAIKQHYLCVGDILRFGNVELEVVDPLANPKSRWTLIANSSWLRGQEFALGDASSERHLLIGREHDCDIVIPSKHLSRHHARIELKNDRLFIQDLNSSSGTFVNEQPIAECELKAGDTLQLDVYSFFIFGPGYDQNRIQTNKANTQTDLNLTTSIHKTPAWQTRPTSPGNRVQEDLYKKRWAASAIAALVLITFSGLLGFLFIR